MILQALKGYYDRKLREGEIAQDGWIQGGLDFLLELDEQGNLLHISDLRESDGKKFKSHQTLLPNIGKQALKHTNSGKDANLLWDNANFVFGLGEKGDARLQSMIDAIDEWIGATEDIGVLAARSFLEKGLANRDHFSLAFGELERSEILNSGNAKIGFCVPSTGFETVNQSPVVDNALAKNLGMSNATNPNPIKGTCLITGQNDVELELTHSVTKGVWGAQSSGACIVSFNRDAFNSYGKQQSLNAPVGKLAASQYGKALNALLDSSKQCIHISDATTVFWSENRSEFETDFSSFFLEPDKDDPDAGVKKIKALFDSVKSGAYFNDDETTGFYILGLAPNAARISVRYWHVGTIRDFSMRIAQYFEDFSIVKPSYDSPYYSMWRILVNTAIQGKSENIQPNLAGDFMRSILAGTPYPTTLLQAALRRIHAGIKRKGSDVVERVTPEIAALLKAYLNRYYRFYKNDEFKEVTMGLDKNRTSIGYQLGRLFAVLEKIQEEANPGLNATIRDRFYGAACSTPVTVFGRLLNLQKHHLGKITNRGKVIFFEGLTSEVVGKINDFPAHLGLHEQGLFAIGYYHQRQDFFTKNEENIMEA